MEFPEEVLYYTTQQKFYYSKKFRTITEYILRIPNYKLRGKKGSKFHHVDDWI